MARSCATLASGNAGAITTTQTSRMGERLTVRRGNSPYIFRIGNEVIGKFCVGQWGHSFAIRASQARFGAAKPLFVKGFSG